MNVVERLRQLSREHFATSARDLRRIALGYGVDHSVKDAQEALKGNVATQVLAPKARFTGKAAAEGPGARVQMDVAEFPKTPNNPGSTPYALVATDVFTRQTYAEPMESKSAAETDEAAKKVLSQMPRQGKNAAITTDDGGEFEHLQDSVLEAKGSTHRLKAGRNDIAVVDRAMQTLKVKLAVAKANKGGDWDDHIKKVVHSYNDNPRSVVHGSPNDATDRDSPQNFLIFQDNAARFQHNFEVARKRQEQLKADGAYRPAISDGSRAHKPRYGPVENLDSIERGALHVVSEDGKKHLLKKVLPVPKGTEEPKGVFGTKPRPPPKQRPEGEAPPARPVRPMTGPIPEPASRAYEPSQPAAPASSASSSRAPVSSGAPATSSEPAFTNARSAGLAAMFGGHEPKRTPEEHAAIKAEAQRKRDEADAARRLKAANKRAKELAEDAAKEKAKADKAEAKRQKELAEEARKAAAKAERAKRRP